MRDEILQAERFGSNEFIDECLNRFSPQSRIRRREVDQIRIMSGRDF